MDYKSSPHNIINFISGYELFHYKYAACISHGLFWRDLSEPGLFFLPENPSVTMIFARDTLLFEIRRPFARGLLFAMCLPGSAALLLIYPAHSSNRCVCVRMRPFHS